jgi:hypothetical protein
MRRLNTAVGIAVLAGALISNVALAQQTQTSSPSSRVERKAEPSGWDKTKAMTRKQWNAAKKKWASEKEQWRDCNNQSKKEKLTAPKSWSFIASCMTKS